MLDPAIQNFLAERKAGWLKEKLKACKTEQEKLDVETKATEKFCLDNWLPDAAKRSGWLSIITHPSKFSHPSAKTSAVIAQTESKTDGFLRSGNVVAEFDVLGNAAALDVYKFLSLQLSDGQTVLTHLEQNSDTIQQQFTLSTLPFSEIKQGLLTIKQASEIAKTSEKIKQVYFPVEDNYHLLSMLTPSGLMFKLKERINHLRFSEEAKQAREDRRAEKHNEQGFDELYNLAVIGFGGTKPQNISVLNSQNGGTAYLLPSLPPQLEIRTLRRPHKSFFEESLYFKEYQESFKSLHTLLAVNYNNANIRDGRDNIIVFIAEQVMEKVWQFRQLEANWTEKTSLPKSEKIWLDAAFTEQRENESEWLNKILVSFSDWLGVAYTKSVGKDKAIFKGDVELNHFKELITDMAEDLR